MNSVSYAERHGYPILTLAESAYLFRSLGIMYTTHRRLALRQAVAKELARKVAKAFEKTGVFTGITSEQVHVSDCYRLHYSDVEDWKALLLYRQAEVSE